MNTSFDTFNPLINTTHCVASEVLQLLLVVERIKADKESHQLLLVLEELKHTFDSSLQIKTALKCSPFRTQSNNFALSALCSVLDDGLGVTSFLSKSARYAQYNGHRRGTNKPASVTEEPDLTPWATVWTEEIPEIIDKKKFHFSNLNRVRLHYPHLQLLLAYTHGKKLLRAACELLSLDYQAFVEEASNWAKQEFNHLNNKTQDDSDIFLPIIEHKIRERATSQYISAFNMITDRIKKHLEWSFTESDYFLPPNIELKQKEWEDWMGRKLGEQPVLSFDVLQADVERAIKEGDLDLIAKRITRSLANKIQPSNFSADYLQSDEYHLNLLFFYEQWSNSNTLLINHRDKQMRLSVKTLQRGLGLSIWREQYQKEHKKLSTLDAAKEFLQQEKGQPYCFGTDNTIKQSYEDIKAFAKSSGREMAPSPLVKLVRSQITRRIQFHCHKVRYVFAPLNVNYEDRVRDIAAKLSNLLDIDMSQCSYSNFCDVYKMLTSQNIKQADRKSLVESLPTFGVQVHSTSFNHYLDRENLELALKADVLVSDR
ncbi:hypothetical protein ACE34P_001516 [Vibrio fluvialis]